VNGTGRHTKNDNFSRELELFAEALRLPSAAARQDYLDRTCAGDATLRQALALKDHTNLAKVLDAGATEAGRPFFVMELVHGVPITTHCDEAQLSTKARLDLFIQVCHAIPHAPQKGIIHRDIKPSNILVTVNDGVAVPKVIDTTHR